MKIESLRDYLDLETEEFLKLAIKIYMKVNFLEKDYPTYKNWYFGKPLKDANNEERNTLFVRSLLDSNKIIAVAILEKDDKFKQISTLYVDEENRNKGIGTALINESLKWLETDKPLVTMQEFRYESFAPIIKKYDWKLVDITKINYKNRGNDLYFNDTFRKNEKTK